MFKCPTCKGSGEITINGSDGDYKAQCYTCGGTGKEIKVITLEVYYKLQQEIAQKDILLQLASNTLGEIMALEVLKSDGKMDGYSQRQPYVWEATVNTYREVNKALGGKTDGNC